MNQRLFFILFKSGAYDEIRRSTTLHIWNVDSYFLSLFQFLKFLQ